MAGYHWDRVDAPDLEEMAREAIHRSNPSNIKDSVSDSRSDGAGGAIFSARSTQGYFHDTQVRVQVKHEESGGSRLIVTPGPNCKDEEADRVQEALKDKIEEIRRERR